MHCRRLLTALTLVLLTAGVARADLNAYLDRVDVSASADLGAFRTQLGTHFEASDAQLDLVFRSVERPADAAVCLWLGRHSGRPIATVLREYRTHRGQGWGRLAQSLGIKPGSADFKALKRGELGWLPTRSAGGKGKAKERVKGK